MIRELFIEIYLLIFRMLFSIFNLFPLKKKTVFVASFGDNTQFVATDITTYTDESVYILHTGSIKHPFPLADQIHVFTFKPSRPLQWLKCIYHLATSHVVYVDNYFGFLAVTPFKTQVRCVQLWHAAGAIKQFGLKDPSNVGRTIRAKDRFQQVYNRFTDVVVGSEKMADIFCESFGLQKSRMLRTGIPRTDFFFDEEAIHRVTRHLEETYPTIKEKKVLLYAPTYRDDALNISDLHIDLDHLASKFKDEYVLLLKLHPAVSFNESIESDFVINVSDFPDVNHLCLVADILISDYSSIPFEYAILERPMIFFAYDLEKYQELRGFWEDYHSLVPGPVVRTTEELAKAISAGVHDLCRIRQFKQDWNTYSNGESSNNLVRALHEVKESVKERSSTSD